MPISETHLPKVLDRMTSGQCLEVLHHDQDEWREAQNTNEALRLFLGVRPGTYGTLYLLARAHGSYRLTPDGVQVKAALEARA